MNMTHIKYEKNPFITWKAMVFNLISSLFGVMFLAITCAAYPIYAFAIPRQVWAFLGEKGFGIIYYIFANSSILRYIHLRSIAKKHENDNGGRVEKHTLVHANRNAFVCRGNSNSVFIG